VCIHSRTHSSFAIARRVARARPDPPGDARARFASTRESTRESTSRISSEDIDRSNRETSRQRIYPKLTVDDRFDARERRAIRAMREDASKRRATTGTTATSSAVRHRDGERGANDG